MLSKPFRVCVLSERTLTSDSSERIYFWLPKVGRGRRVAPHPAYEFKSVIFYKKQPSGAAAKHCIGFKNAAFKIKNRPVSPPKQTVNISRSSKLFLFAIRPHTVIRMLFIKRFPMFCSAQATSRHIRASAAAASSRT